MVHAILHVVTAHKAPTLRSWRETSWIAWEFSEHQNLLFWLLTLQLNVNDASSKKNTNFLISFSSSLETTAKNFFIFCMLLLDILYRIFTDFPSPPPYYACFAEYCKWVFLFNWIHFIVTFRSPVLHDWWRIFGDLGLGCSVRTNKCVGCSSY